MRILAVRAGDERAGVTDPELAAGIEGPGTIGAPIVRFRRHDTPVAPDHGDGAAPRRRRELVGNPRRLRRRLGEHLRRLGGDARRVAELERPERRVHDVTGHVA